MSDVTVRVLAFAAVRELLGMREMSLSLAAGATAGDVLEALCTRWPGLRPYTGALRLAVNGDYVSREHVLRAGDEVAVLPPVAGG
jgi:molybdopterin converting factor subunit 1